MATIYILSENGDIKKTAEYSIGPKAALIAFVRQMAGDYNTMSYPENIPGMRESTTAADHWYFDDTRYNQVIAAYPS